jgi:hypothetical protein
MCFIEIEVATKGGFTVCVLLRERWPLKKVSLYMCFIEIEVVTKAGFTLYVFY